MPWLHLSISNYFLSFGKTLLTYRSCICSSIWTNPCLHYNCITARSIGHCRGRTVYSPKRSVHQGLMLASAPFQCHSFIDLVWPWVCLGVQVSQRVRDLHRIIVNDGSYYLTSISLTQEASLREVDNLRQQIYRIKGGSTVSFPSFCGGIHSHIISG